MTATYGIKVSRPGFDVNTAEPNELSFSSEYKTLKVHASGSGSITDGSRTVTIPHNLGYVPFFMVHTTMDQGFGSSLFSSGDYVLAPAGLGGVLANPDVGVNDDLLAYADATNLYIRAQANFGKVIAIPGSDLDFGNKIGATYLTGFAGTGNVSGSDISGAVRFLDVAIPQGTTVVSAQVFLMVDFKGAGAGSVKYKVFGMDEDNASDFAGDPFGRPQTSANYSYTRSLNVGLYMGSDVTNIVNEIVARGGWSSGNAMGFMFLNDSSPNDVYMGDIYDGDVSIDPYLEILFANTIASYKYTIFKNQIE